MADKRGGYRRPDDRSPKASGIGKNSKRTDTQAIKSPNVQDSTDLQVGDRERIRQGQKVAPLSQTPSPSVSAPPRGGSSGAAAGAGAELPPHLFAKPTSRPLEDEMTPASPPPMEPQDDQEVVLQFLIDAFGDENAAKMLEEKRGANVASAPAPMAPTTFEPEVAQEPGEPEAVELGEQPLDEEVVDEEAPLA